MNLKKRLVVIGVIFLLVLSTITFAATDSTDNCAGFFGVVKCFLWGNPANRAGMSWWDRGNVVGGAIGKPVDGTDYTLVTKSGAKVISIDNKARMAYQLSADGDNWEPVNFPSGSVVQLVQSGQKGSKSFLIGESSEALEVAPGDYKTSTNQLVYKSAQSNVFFKPDGTAFTEGKVQESIGMGFGKIYQVDSQGKTTATLVPVPTVVSSTSVYVKVGAGESISDKITITNGLPAGDLTDADGNPMFLTSKGYALTQKQVAAVGKKLVESGMLAATDIVTEPDKINQQYLAALEGDGELVVDSNGGLGFKDAKGKTTPVKDVAVFYTTQDVPGLSKQELAKAGTSDLQSSPSVVAGGETLQPATPSYELPSSSKEIAKFSSLMAAAAPSSKLGVTYQNKYDQPLTFKDGKFYTQNNVPYAGTEVIASTGTKYNLDTNGKGTVVATYVPISHESLKSSKPVYIKVGANEKIQNLVSFSAKGVPNGDNFVDGNGDKLYVTSQGAVVTEQQMQATKKVLEDKGISMGTVVAVGAEDTDEFNKKMLAALEGSGEYVPTSEGLVFKPFEGEIDYELKEQVPNAGDVESVKELSSTANKKTLVMKEIPKKDVAEKSESEVISAGSISDAKEHKAAQTKKASETAVKLFEAGVDDFWGTDEDAIFAALKDKSSDEIELIKKKYKEIAKTDLDTDMKSELNDEDYAKYASLTEVMYAEQEKKFQEGQQATDVLIANVEQAMIKTFETPKAVGNIPLEATKGADINGVEYHENTENGVKYVYIVKSDGTILKQIFEKFNEDQLAAATKGSVPKPSGKPQVAEGKETSVSIAPEAFEVAEVEQLLNDLKTGAKEGQYYEDNPAAIDKLYEKGLLTKEQYEEINGNGAFNGQETLAYAQTIVQENLDKSLKEGLAPEEYAQYQKYLRSESPQVAASPAGITVPLSGGVSTESTNFEALEAAQLMDDLKSGATNGQYYEDNPAVVDNLYAKGLLTKEEYDDITGEGVFNVQGNLADAQEIVQKKQKLALGQEWDLLTSSEKELFGGQEQFKSAKAVFWSAESGGSILAEGQMIIQDKKDLAVGLLADDRAKVQAYADFLDQEAFKVTDSVESSKYLEAAEKAKEQVKKYDEAIAAVEQGNYEKAEKLKLQAEVVGNEMDKSYESGLAQSQLMVVTKSPYPTANNLANKLGFDSVKTTSLSPDGVIAYESGDNMLTIYPDGSYELDKNKKDSKGNNVYLYTLKGKDDSSKPKLVLGSGFDQLSGEYYGDNSKQIDELHTQGYLSDEQYDQINGEYGFGEENMAYVKKLLQSNQDIARKEWAQLTEEQKNTFDDKNDFDQTKLAFAPSESVNVQVGGVPSPLGVVAPAPTVPTAPSPPLPASAPSKEVTDATNNLNKLFDNTGGLSSVGKDEFEKALGGADLAQVKAKYKEQYGKELDAVAKDEMSDVALAAYQEKSKESLLALKQATPAAPAASATMVTPGAPAAPAPPQPSPEPSLVVQKQDIETELASGKITHAEAAEKMKPLVAAAKENAAKVQSVKDPSSAQLTDAPEDSTIEVDGKTLIKKNGKWVDNKNTEVTEVKDPKNLKSPDAQKAEQEVAELEIAQQKYDDQSFWLESMTNSGWYQGAQSVGQYFGAVGAFAQKLGSYQALSNLMFPGVGQGWTEWANKEMFNTAAGKWIFGVDEQLMREVCDYDEAKRSKSPGQSAAFILDPYGTAQSVGALQAEKSSQKSPILCERNTAPEAESEWKCAKQQVCVNDFCYADADEDGEPDSSEPAQGYFYKISWGVTAPADQANTPYVDEDGIAVKLNLELHGEKSLWIFKKVGTPPEQVIELKNGNSDGGVIVRYLKENYNEVCIMFNTKMIDIEGEEVENICADFVISNKGEVEYGGSDQTSSVTSSSPEVTMNI
jgi:hypothetical protein